jgi:hypothetical protein
MQIWVRWLGQHGRKDSLNDPCEIGYRTGVDLQTMVVVTEESLGGRVIEQTASGHFNFKL